MKKEYNIKANVEREEKKKRVEKTFVLRLKSKLIS
jgi:hypothetical protein